MRDTSSAALIVSLGVWGMVLLADAVTPTPVFAQDDAVRGVYSSTQAERGEEVEFDDKSQGWLTAVDAVSGEVKWRYRSERPMVANVTTTSGGLVLTGELSGDFLALDAHSGTVLYRFNTGGAIGGGIVTYQLDGKQYVAVTSGKPSGFWVDEHPGSPTIFVFGL